MADHLIVLFTAVEALIRSLDSTLVAAVVDSAVALS
jgi:hypothetical protein